jgi:DNA repair exonuclease SbcCD nuclease subunit
VSRRVLHVADVHLGLLRFGARAEDQDRLLERIADVRDEYAADIVVIAGDLFQGRRPAAPEILSVVKFLKRVTRRAAVVITAGNHDGPGEVEDFAVKPTGWLAAVEMENVYAIPGMATINVRDVTFRILPYVHRRSRLAPELDRLVSEPGPLTGGHYGPFFVGHLTVAGSRLTASSVMQIGWDLTVGVEAFGAYSGAMLGHIHHQQSFSPRIAYAGSPERYDFGEETQAKGALVWDMDGPPMPVDLGARKLLTLRLPTPVPSDWLKEVTPGSVLRVIVTGPSASWATLSRDLHHAALEAGASWVRLEHVLERGPRARVQMDPNAEVLGALRSWCRLVDEDFAVLEGPATEIVGL